MEKAGGLDPRKLPFEGLISPDTGKRTKYLTDLGFFIAWIMTA